MALRRPLLLLCVLTIVLGINYKVSRPAFPEAENTNFKTPFTPLTPVSDGKPSSPAKLMAKLTDKKSRPPFREAEDADLCSPFRAIVFPRRSVQNLKRTKEKARSPDTGLKTMPVDREWMGLVENMWITVEKYPGPADATRELNFDMSRIIELYIEKDSQRRELERTNKMEGIFALWNKMHGTRGTTLSDVHASNQGALALPPNAASVTNWTDEKCSVDILSASLSSHNQSIIQQSPPKLSKQQTVVINTGFYGSDLQNHTEVYEADHALWHARSAQDLENFDQYQVYPGAATEINSSELSLGGYLFDFAIYRKEFQPNGTDFRCSIEQDEQHVDALLLRMCLYSFFRHKISKDEDVTAAMQQQVKLLSLCIMLARTLLCKEDLRRRLLNPKHMAMMNGNSIQDIIKTAVRNILTREGLPSLLLNCTANDKPLEDILAKFIEDETPSLPMKDRRLGHLSSYLGMQDEQNGNKIKPKNIHGQDKSAAYAGFDLEKDTHRDSKWNGLSQYLTSFIPRRQVVYTVFPASFLPNPAASVKDRMSHVLNRLASLNSLPASCDISRVRLAEAGFYYDNSKTVRDASNVHEVVCYSCGLTYGQWKKGDNPTTIHVHIKPDCEYVRSKNVSNSTPLASSSNASSHISEDRSSLASSRVSMSNDNVSLLSTSASTLSSGHGSLTTESMQQTSMPHNSLSLADSGLGTGSFSSGASGSDSSHHQTPFENRTAATRSDGGDLATDCFAIAPQPRSSNQSTFSGLARDSAVSSQLSYQSSYSTSRDTSRARALDLDDRPPLDMTSAVYPQFCRHQERRATFSTWPLSDLFRPDDLVMQGFYYAGYADCLRCFYCGVGLKSWAEDDDVMVEHIRWRPSCGYVLNTKGRQYVDRILNSLGVCISSFDTEISLLYTMDPPFETSKSHSRKKV
ncbi:uncharacterized protein [Littorina saxatilis]|uniref:uncharacterized protein n=1 Tax=Littorina saxatilis TaxID=31220 RepID=UPI0038B55F6E